MPVLVLFGAKDEIVPAQSSIDQTIAILKQHGNANVTVRVFADSDHTLHVPPPSPGGWPHLPDGFPDVIADFVRSVGCGETTRKLAPLPVLKGVDALALRAVVTDDVLAQRIKHLIKKMSPG